jgi:hypothetical protein
VITGTYLLTLGLILGLAGVTWLWTRVLLRRERAVRNLSRDLTPAQRAFLRERWYDREVIDTTAHECSATLDEGGSR